MIIKIEDAPAVKHITIDIDFTGEGEEVVITNTGVDKPVKHVPMVPRHESLDLDADFTQTIEEEVSKPEIVHEERAAKVSTDMNDLEI